MTEAEAYEVAYHEAAHCVMSIITKGQVFYMEVYDPPRAGCGGVCASVRSEHWKYNVWTSLAGPIADSIRTGKPETYYYRFGGSMDYARAEKEIHDWILPPVPEDLKPLLDDDPRSFLDVAKGDWHLKVKGTQKRRLRVYTERLLSADELAQEILHKEATMIRAFILDTPGILDAIDYLARRLAEKRRLEAREIIDLLHDVWNVPRHRMAA